MLLHTLCRLPEYLIGVVGHLWPMAGNVQWAQLDSMRQIDKLEPMIEEQQKLMTDMAERELIEGGEV